MKRTFIFGSLLIVAMLGCRQPSHPVLPWLTAKYLALSDSLLQGGQAVAALRYLDSLAGSAEPEGEDERLIRVRVLLKRGDALFALKRYHEAYRSYYTARMLLVKLDPNCRHARLRFDFYVTLANISYGQNQFLDAVRQQRYAIAAFQHCARDDDQRYLIQGALDNIGLAYVQAGRTDSALLAYQEALKVIGEARPGDTAGRVRFSVARGVILGNRGTALLKKGDTSAAERDYLENISLNGRPGYAPQDALITRMKLAELAVARGRLAQAGGLLQQIAVSPDTLPEPQDKLQLLLLKAAYARKTGQLAQALAFNEDYIRQLSALRKHRASLMNADYGKEFELLENQYELQDLQRRNELKTLYLVLTGLIALLAGGTIFVFLRNRRKTRRYLQEVQFYNEQLQVALQEKEKLLGVVAHDLKNPVNAIQVLSVMLRDEAPAGSGIKEDLQMITAASQNMTGIIDELLSGSTALAPVVQRGEIDLALLLGECISLLQYRADEKGQRIVLHDGRGAWIYANRSKIWRVVNNLLVNAIKFSPRDSLIEVSVSVSEGLVTVAVKDQGIGMPPEMLGQLFEQRVANRREGTSGEVSFGLGLAICRAIIEAKGGRIWAESKVGLGTTVYFQLPLVTNGDHVSSIKRLGP